MYGGVAIFATHVQEPRIEPALCLRLFAPRGFCEGSGRHGSLRLRQLQVRLKAAGYSARFLPGQGEQRAAVGARNHLFGRRRLYVVSASQASPPLQKAAPAAEHGRVQGSPVSFLSRSPYPVSPHLNLVRSFLGGDVTDATTTGLLPSSSSSASSAVDSARMRRSIGTRGLNGALRQALSQPVLCAYQRSHAIPRV